MYASRHAYKETDRYTIRQACMQSYRKHTDILAGKQTDGRSDTFRQAIRQTGRQDSQTDRHTVR